MRSTLKSLGGEGCGWGCCGGCAAGGWGFSSARLAARRSPLALRTEGVRLVVRRRERDTLGLVFCRFCMLVVALLTLLGFRIGMPCSGVLGGSTGVWLLDRLLGFLTISLSPCSSFSCMGHVWRANALSVNLRPGVGVSGRGSTCSGFISSRGVPRLESMVFAPT